MSHEFSTWLIIPIYCYSISGSFHPVIPSPYAAPITSNNKSIPPKWWLPSCKLQALQVNGKVAVLLASNALAILWSWRTENDGKVFWKRWLLYTPNKKNMEAEKLAKLLCVSWNPRGSIFRFHGFKIFGGKSNSGCFQKSVVILGKFHVKNKTDILHDHFSPTLKLQ